MKLHAIILLPPGFEHITMIDTLCEDFLPDGRLPTLEEIHKTFSDPIEADPRLVTYCYFRPEYERLFIAIEELKEGIKQDKEGEGWKFM